MLEGKSIALVIFTFLNAVGVVFFIYVLAHWWKEGRRSKSAIRFSSDLPAYDAEHAVVVAGARAAEEARQENGRLIRFPIAEGLGRQHEDGNDVPDRTRETSQSAAQ